MPSPFPGMDPWLEAPGMFPNVHDRLGIFLQDALNEALPPDYVATTKNRVRVVDELRRDPDVALFNKNNGHDYHGHNLVSLEELVAIAKELSSDPLEEVYLEIVSAQRKRLVTAIVIISLSNKMAGMQGRELYRDKPHEYPLSGVHLVEIDLLRTGPHVSATPKGRLLGVVGSYDYHVSVMAVIPRPRYYPVGFHLQDQLPAFELPLDPGVSPTTSDLQSVFNRVYDGGRYPVFIKYTQPCDPPLTPEQTVWAETILRE